MPSRRVLSGAITESLNVDHDECLHEECCPVASRKVRTWTIVNAFTKSFVRCYHESLNVDHSECCCA